MRDCLLFSRLLLPESWVHTSTSTYIMSGITVRGSSEFCSKITREYGGKFSHLLGMEGYKSYAGCQIFEMAISKLLARLIDLMGTRLKGTL